MTLIEQASPAQCALCAQQAHEVLPVPPSVEDEPRPGVPLCLDHRRAWTAGLPIVGFCPGGNGHYGRRATRCVDHGAFFTDPIA